MKFHRNPALQKQAAATERTPAASVTIWEVRVKVLFFGQLKDIVGRSEDAIELEEGTRLSSIFKHYAGRFPRMHDLEHSIVMACNRQFADGSAEVRDGDEVAFLPPVSGGSEVVSPSRYTHAIAHEDGNFFALTRQPIEIESLKSRLTAGTDGAVVAFEGVVRNNTKGRPTRFLDYECYEAMAIGVMAELGRSIASSYAIGRIALVHRLGRMDIGETSVAVIVTAPHRKPAFEAALEGINRLKKTVPIWKKEYFADGEVWVEGEWDDSVLKR
jgi:molybdopterin synthase catalytic subunit